MREPQTLNGVLRSQRPAPRPRGSAGEWLHDKAPEIPGVALNGNVASTSSSSRLIVSNLHYELTPKDLTQIFGQVGTLVREPLIRYDRSGRSSGVAIISFETPAEAAAAKTRFDGKLAKGQPMSIAFHTPPPQPRSARRNVSSPASLINRIQKPPLLDRLSRNESKPQTTTAAKSGPGPIRTRNRGAGRVPKKPKTQEELDMELDTFMKDDKSAPSPVAAQADGDVEMA
ncbi:hypothetical protein AcW1_009512 [Taiwanofungus camphoratus]|nr:hypothetical protein AcV7_002689 [Antrodia cinnamomea]KAI0947863.1 hypothetical protein AcW1_009512 [Antrodia cinnamomea]